MSNEASDLPSRMEFQQRDRVVIDSTRGDNRPLVVIVRENGV